MGRNRIGMDWPSSSTLRASLRGLSRHWPTIDMSQKLVRLRLHTLRTATVADASEAELATEFAISAVLRRAPFKPFAHLLWVTGVALPGLWMRPPDLPMFS